MSLCPFPFCDDNAPRDPDGGDQCLIEGYLGRVRLPPISGALKGADIGSVKTGEIGSVKSDFDITGLMKGDVGFKPDLDVSLGLKSDFDTGSMDIDTFLLKDPGMLPDAAFKAVETAAIKKTGVDIEVAKIGDDFAVKGESGAAAKSAVVKLTERASAAAKKVGQKIEDVFNKAVDFASNNRKLVAGGLTAGVIAAIAYARWKAKNGRTFNIVTIEGDTDGVRIVLAESEAIDTDDWVDITQSNSTPSVDGTSLSILRVPNSVSIVISGSITTEGSAGVMTLHTSFESQLKQVTRDAVAGVIDSAEAAASGVIKGTADALGITPIIDWFKTYGKYILLVFILCLLLVVIVKIKGLLK